MMLSHSPKLRNAFASAALIAIFYFASRLTDDTFSAYWYDLELSQISPYGAGQSQDILFTAGLFAVLVFWWHGADLLDKGSVATSGSRWLYAYKFCIFFLVLGLIGASIIFAGLIEVMECELAELEMKIRSTGRELSEGDIKTTFGLFCTPTFGGGSVPLVLLPAFLILLQASAKTIRTIKNRLRKPQ